MDEVDSGGQERRNKVDRAHTHNSVTTQFIHQIYCEYLLFMKVVIVFNHMDVHNSTWTIVNYNDSLNCGTFIEKIDRVLRMEMGHVHLIGNSIIR